VNAEVWDELVATALVGTARRGVPEPARRHLAHVLGAAPGDTGTEVAVLTAAGVIASERRTGIRTVTGATPPPAAPIDARPHPGPDALRILDLLVGGAAGLGRGATGATVTETLLVEWLARVAATGRVVPADRLPDLLDRATGATDLRPPLRAAGGTTLAWLAARNPRWSWAAAGDPSTAEVDALAETWRTGAGAGRVEALQELRQRDPERARAALEETWSGERAAARAEALRALAIGLGPADEPLLEAALDDRAASVRAAAAEVLARLPGSARSGRMADRLRPLVTVGGLLRKTIDVALPEEPDAAARRDGIVDAGAPQGVGRRAWWLQQIVAGTPLAFWTEERGLSPGAVADRAQAQRELAEGLIAATLLEADPTWAAALAGYQPYPALLALLPPQAALDLVTRRLRQADDAKLAWLLTIAPAPWTAPFTIAAVTRLRAVANTIALDQALGAVARGGHPDAGPALETWIAELADAETRRRAVRATAHALSLRRAIEQALPPPTEMP
jgi:hypothetical protein